MPCMTELHTPWTLPTQVNIINKARKNSISIPMKLSPGSIQQKAGPAFFEKQKWNTMFKVFHLNQWENSKTDSFIIKNTRYARKTFLRSHGLSSLPQNYVEAHL